MKTIKKNWFALLLLVPALILSSCDDLLTQKVTIDAPDVEFTVDNPVSVKANVKGVAMEVVELYNDTIDLNIAAKVKEKLGVKLNIVKGMALKNGSVQVIAPEDFDMDELKDLKLYYNDTETLVAEVESIDYVEKIVKFKLVKADLYSKLNGGEKLRVIITNSKKLSPQSVTLKFSSNYEITVGV